MKLKPTRADKRHYEDLIDALNDAYLEGKSMTQALELIVLRRHEVEDVYYGKLHKARHELKMLAARLTELGIDP